MREANLVDIPTARAYSARDYQSTFDCPLSPVVSNPGGEPMLQVDKPIGKPDTYFSLWTATEAGIRDVSKLKQTIEKASAMIRESKGTCHLYVSIGGEYDMIGVASGVDDRRIVEIQHAIKSFGTLHTTFLKTKEFSRKDFQSYIRRVDQLRNIKS
jgi:uncharacterized protein with GYD domain